MSAFGPARALAPLERARKLDPLDEETLGRLAAVYGAVDGLDDTLPGTRMRRVIDEVVRRERALRGVLRRAGLGARPDAQVPARRARIPGGAAPHAEARGGPGAARHGVDAARRRVAAAEQLDDAFQADPFNARVKNTLEVLDLLKEYHTIETAHFRVRHDRGRDSLLAEYAARYSRTRSTPRSPAGSASSRRASR
jgi:hypothetical protein